MVKPDAVNGDMRLISGSAMTKRFSTKELARTVLAKISSTNVRAELPEKWLQDHCDSSITKELNMIANVVDLDAV